MIIHSIVQPEIIFEGLRDNNLPETKVVEWNGVKVQVRLVGDDTYEIDRIITTNIKDYLRPELQPGKRIKACYIPKEE